MLCSPPQGSVPHRPCGRWTTGRWVRSSRASACPGRGAASMSSTASRPGGRGGGAHPDGQLGGNFSRPKIFNLLIPPPNPNPKPTSLSLQWSVIEVGLGRGSTNRLHKTPTRFLVLPPWKRASHSRLAFPPALAELALCITVVLPAREVGLILPPRRIDYMGSCPPSFPLCELAAGNCSRGRKGGGRNPNSTFTSGGSLEDFTEPPTAARSRLKSSPLWPRR